MKDAEFYNKESLKYSSKRYPRKASTYIQYFFKRRLQILLIELGEICEEKTGLNLLEVGCADGVVLRAIVEAFPQSFSSMTGIDTAKDMVSAAKSLTNDSRIAFYERGAEPKEKRDVIIEIGVANYADFDEELRYAKENLIEGGTFILSIAAKGSINAFFGKGDGYNNFLSYREYESRISHSFRIVRYIPVGFYIPIIWRVPAIARYIQAVKERVMAPIAPNVFHEKVYVLKAK